MTSVLIMEQYKCIIIRHNNVIIFHRMCLSNIVINKVFQQKRKILSEVSGQYANLTKTS